VKQLKIVPVTTLLFQEPALWKQVAYLAAAWFRTYCVGFSVGQNER